MSPGQPVREIGTGADHAPLTLLGALFFLSGAAGLVYEVVWTRALSDVTGSTSLAMASVFSVFLASLAVGARVFGSSRARARDALVLYGVLEVLVGVLGAAATLVALEAGDAIAALAPGGTLGVIVFAVGVSAVLVGPPTVLMGGTLPVLMNGLAGWTDPRRHVAVFYGLNTIGAAFGALAAGMVSIWMLGLRGTAAVAVMVNLGVGAAAIATRARFPAGAAETLGGGADRASRSDAPSVAGVPPTALPLTWPALAFLSGLVVLALEVLWGRVMRFVLGDRTIAVTMVLFTAIVALGAGSLVAARIGRRLSDARRHGAPAVVGAVLILGSAAHLLAVPVGLSFATTPELPGSLTRMVVVWLLIAPPLAVLGVGFPLLLWSAEGVADRPGDVVGRLYLYNSAGAVTGAVAASFALTRWAGTAGGFRLIGFLTAAAAIPLLLRAAPPEARLRKPLAALAVLCLLAWPLLPGRLIHVQGDETLLDADEDAYGVQVLVETTARTLRVRNNRLSLVHDLGAPETDHAQQMAAHLTVLLAEDVSDVLNVGTGYGITAGTFTLYDDVERLETVEILPFLVEKQDGVFAPYNFRYVGDRRVTLAQGDGRRWLARSERAWDVISVNVLDPYLPGSSSLYTVDFWRMARERLAPGGVYTQLFWGEDLDLLVRGLTTAFPTVLFFPAYGRSSFNVVAFRDAVSAEEARMRVERIGPQAAAALAQVGGSPEGMQELLLNAWPRSAEMVRRARQAGDVLHTDDRPVLEYRWAHGVTGVSAFDSPLVRQ